MKRRETTRAKGVRQIEERQSLGRVLVELCCVE